ncbi:hypothetical protein A1Q2_01533 [Trichosporon asahii var. asahii CBS 8904]|uniref:Uncharacterized protein n=2 Tax=Trichosporon asahii var. asahii TaxID=189963 RepID=K1VXH9_TRIAC|nr:hypothetical protein A1Q1_05169 [Trichosporon asahii var. asahii CBS 2479]EJT46212.1 hypothetical protein A1Q1_05169 [Trichosporon asahii var. asahii CBS 2479]EKD04187.1 hypothetical protein A1Q2_01533 [Trichosporon asahii var. asahii CBS 8904]
MPLMTVAITCHDPMPDRIAGPFMRAFLPALRQWGAPLHDVGLDWRKTPDGQVFSVYMDRANAETCIAVGNNFMNWLQGTPFAHYKEWSWTYFPTEQAATRLMTFTWH